MVGISSTRKPENQPNKHFANDIVTRMCKVPVAVAIVLCCVQEWNKCTNSNNGRDLKQKNARNPNVLQTIL